MGAASTGHICHGESHGRSHHGISCFNSKQGPEDTTFPTPSLVGPVPHRAHSSGNLWTCEHSEAPILGLTCIKMCLTHKMGEVKGGEWDPKFCISLPLNLNCMFKSNFLNGQKYHTHTLAATVLHLASTYTILGRGSSHLPPALACETHSLGPCHTSHRARAGTLCSKLSSSPEGTLLLRSARKPVVELKTFCLASHLAVNDRALASGN